ncbi:unnamed protein product, partial [Scytosiphon promiscuus]
KVSLEAALRALKEAATSEAAAAAEVKKELASRPTVAEVKTLRHQLRVLQQLEFNANDDDEEEGAGMGSVIAGDEPHGADPEDTASHVERTMEQVIRGRVRRLEADLTSCRRLAEERGAEAARLQHSLDSAAALSAERLETINRLEDDLATAFHSGKGSGKGGGNGGANASGTPRGGYAGGVQVEGTDALRELLGVGEDGEPRGVQAGAGEGAGVGEVELDSHGVLG